MSERTYKSDALILYHRNLGEADRLVTLLTWEKGKITAVARGARKVKSRLAAGVDLFTHGRYQFHRGRSLDLITGQEVKEHFSAFREDAALYPYGLFLSEITGKLIQSEEPQAEPCALLLEGWRLLCDRELPDPILLCRAFELKMMELAGFCPYLEGCLQCGDAGALLFSPRRGGLFCTRCAESGTLRLSAGTAALARRLLEAPLDRVKLLRSSALQRRELAEAAASFRRYHLQIEKLRSLQLIESMKLPD
ncbi:MAG: DNA repair protein RecO [Firmicutes bacterium]|nr:DNA repair protein RecO [Bacillota bacterium]